MLSKACHLHCCFPLKQHSAFSPLRGSCALPTNMFNSFADTRGTLVTTTEKRQKRGWGRARGGREKKLEGTKCLLCICYWQMCNEWMNEWPKTRPRRLKTFGSEHQSWEAVGAAKSYFLVFWLTSGVDGSGEDAAGHLGVLPLNQRLIKRTFRGMD